MRLVSNDPLKSQSALKRWNFDFAVVRIFLVRIRKSWCVTWRAGSGPAVPRQDMNGGKAFKCSKCLTLVPVLCYSSRCRLYMGGILVRREAGPQSPEGGE